jgi:hypothetical protein
MRKTKTQIEKSWDQMDYTLLMRDMSPELLQHVYFICKYKEGKGGKSSFFKAGQQ